MSTLSAAIKAGGSALNAERTRIEVAVSNLANAESTRSVVEDTAPFQKVYQPGHPDADENGFVSMPNVDASGEMVELLQAARSYQANLAAITVMRDMVARALELGR
jgi:flagellar basal-body rod protein FlgC